MIVIFLFYKRQKAGCRVQRNESLWFSSSIYTVLSFPSLCVRMKFFFRNVYFHVTGRTFGKSVFLFRFRHGTYFKNRFFGNRRFFDFCAASAAAFCGICALVCCFQESQKSPCGEHTRTAGTDKRKRNAGERQNIRRSEYIETGLE